MGSYEYSILLAGMQMTFSYILPFEQVAKDEEPYQSNHPIFPLTLQAFLFHALFGMTDVVTFHE